MRTSETTNEISEALAKAQSEMKNATLNCVNPHFKNRYADMAAVRDAIVPALAKNGIAVIQATDWDEAGFALVTRLLHKSGQWLEGRYPLRMADNPQHMGSQMTYARRYALSSMCAVSAEDDDDAEGASKAKVTDIGPSRSPKTRSDGQQKSAYKARKDGDWDAVMEFRSITNLDQLTEWYRVNRTKIEAMPAGWQDHFYPLYEDHRASLKEPAITDAG